MTGVRKRTQYLLSYEPLLCGQSLYHVNKTSQRCLIYCLVPGVCLLCYNLLFFFWFCVVCLHVCVCFCFFACVGTFSKNNVLKAVDILLESSYYPIFPCDRLLKRAASFGWSGKRVSYLLYMSISTTPRRPPPWCILNQDGRPLQ